MKTHEKVWITCDDCDGSGLDPEVGRAREDDMYMFYCTKCSGSGGWWNEQEKEKI